MDSSHLGERETTLLDEGHELRREAWIMSLYISIVLLAAITALPETFGEDAEGGLTQLVLTIWGTTIGLALAHWFAFSVVAIGFSDGALSAHDLKSGAVQVSAAVGVALVSTLPILVLSTVDLAIDAAIIGPCIILGLAGYLIARKARHSKSASMVGALVVVALGFVVAIVKSVLSGGH